MKEVVDMILEQVEADISEIDLYGYNIIETSLSMVHSCLLYTSPSPRDA